MLGYSCEFLALLVLFIIFITLVGRWEFSSGSSRLFLVCISVNALTAAANIVTGFTILYASSIPLWVNMLTNTIYYMLNMSMIAAYTLYSLINVGRFAYNKTILRPFIIVYIFLYIFVELLCLINIPTGILFYFDDALNYKHGVIWFIGYILMTISIIIGFIVAFRSQRGISYSLMSLLKYVVPSIYLMFLYKLLFPSMFIESFIGTVTGLYIFIAFQSSTLDIDSLTKLKNLDSFFKTLVSRNRTREPYHIFLVSLRDFGILNNTIGYEGGNEILFHFSKWLSDFNKGYDVFRYAPVSFAIIIPATDKFDNEEYLHKLIDSLPTYWKYEDQVYRVNPYFVDLKCERILSTPTQIMDALDFARQEVKTSGKNHNHYDDSVIEQLDYKKDLIAYLKDSIRSKRFEVFYQPIYSAEDNAFTSAEALIRLKDKDGNMIPAETFMSIAENSGLDPQINQMMIESVCSFISHSKNIPLRTISINLTLLQLQDLSFAEELQRIVNKYGVSRDFLNLEVTERILLSEDSNIQLSIFKLRLAGFTLLLDDFGTGYSNFSSLLKCRFDKIKLDKSLLHSDNSKNIAVIETLIDLFHRNGQTVVVEGVETEVQKTTLIDNGADYLQGYYLSAPLSEEKFLEFLLDHMNR